VEINERFERNKNGKEFVGSLFGGIPNIHILQKLQKKKAMNKSRRYFLKPLRTKRNMQNFISRN